MVYLIFDNQPVEVTLLIQMAYKYYLKTYQMNLKAIFLAFSILIGICSSVQVVLEQPTSQIFTDDSQNIRLALNEKFSLPINSKTISYQIQTIPKNNKQCTFEPSSFFYKQVTQTDLNTNEEEVITSILALKKKEIIFLMDQKHQIRTHSLDRHSLLKELSPKRKISESNIMSSVCLVATQDEHFVYYITPNQYFFFKPENSGSEKQQFVYKRLEGYKLQGKLVDVSQAFFIGKHLIVLSKQSGIFVYQANKKNQTLALVQTIVHENGDAIDIEVNMQTSLIYVLDQKQAQIHVYEYNPSGFPNADQMTTTILKIYDKIDIAKITNKHGTNYQRNKNIDLEISLNREEQTLMVMFLHNMRNIIAQISYKSNRKQFSFVRYFKFSMIVNEIHLIQDILLVVGKEILGMFPYGIHPRLIQEEFNGFMSLGSLYRVKHITRNHVVGIHQNTIEYGKIEFDSKAQLNCKLCQTSTLRTLKFRANFTRCEQEDRLLYESYCQYEKTFTIEEMDIAISAPMADSLWIALIIFILLIMIGICFLFVMQKKKEKEIKRLYLYFQQKRNAPPMSSDRRGMHVS